MAGLLCLCNNGMSNSDVPSDSIAEIYKIERIKESIENNMDLVDLSDDDFEYWYCQNCKRITVLNNKTGHYYRSYSRVI